MATAKDKIMEDNAYWQRLAALAEWSLSGFSGRTTATYITSGGKRLQLAASQRDDIVRAVERASAPQW